MLPVDVSVRCNSIPHITIVRRRSLKESAMYRTEFARYTTETAETAESWHRTNGQEIDMKAKA